MDRARVFWVARIAVSATCAVACVALIVLWVRSNWYFDGLEKLTTSRRIRVWSVGGRLALEQVTPPPRIPTGDTLLREAILREMSWGRTYFCQPIGWSGALATMGEHVMGFGYSSGSMQTIITGPHWAFLLLFGALATAPWVKWSRQFSLRTLLIVTTLVAFGLGLAMAFR